jgi:CubicO group peptidase (beta-lactamase class C family)
VGSISILGYRDVGSERVGGGRCDLPLVFPTGENWQYSNLGYFLLAEVVAKVSGQPWPNFVQQRIFAPLGMNANGIVDA